MAVAQELAADAGLGNVMVCEEADVSALYAEPRPRSASRLEELVAGMPEADESPDTLVAHCRMHQVIARKPL